ncbi:MAG: hypothetical protein QM526_02510 [Alphaproteobacteria bacterium]|nr:hypothetical protein [Alphaproteobacteria bacterium]
MNTTAPSSRSSLFGKIKRSGIEEETNEMPMPKAIDTHTDQTHFIPEELFSSFGDPMFMKTEIISSKVSSVPVQTTKQNTANENQFNDEFNFLNTNEEKKYSTFRSVIISMTPLHWAILLIFIFGVYISFFGLWYETPTTSNNFLKNIGLIEENTPGISPTVLSPENNINELSESASSAFVTTSSSSDKIEYTFIESKQIDQSGATIEDKKNK